MGHGRQRVTIDGPLLAPPELVAIDEYEFERNGVAHNLNVGGLRIQSWIATKNRDGDPKGAWWKAYLKGGRPEPLDSAEHAPIRTLDVFCGPGGLANGIGQLAAELGRELVPELIVDQDEEAGQVYAANHGARRVSTASVASLVDFAVRRGSSGSSFLYRPEFLDDSAAQVTFGVDMVLAGPPCQGHSNLNNHTRREDPRNSLYLTAPAIAVAAGAPICIIENVPAVLHDSQQVVAIAEQLFRSEGYEVASGVISASDLGWPQTRKRHFMVACHGSTPVPLGDVVELLGEEEPRSVWWAIEDLADIDSKVLIDKLPELSEENQARINWLFDNDEFDLDLPERPLSHREGTTYTSVYGRMHFDRPAPTITTGFMSPGRGRFIHPTQRRVITAHEAARIQGFPDEYMFTVNPSRPPSRSKLAKWIGDAVPMPLGYAAALSAFAAMPRE
jgi:DNA (cytosine-5)-methyltransferase 1